MVKIRIAAAHSEIEGVFCLDSGYEIAPPPLLLKVTGAHGKFQGGVFGALRQWASLTDSFTDQSDNWLLSGWGSKIQIDQYALSFWTS